MWNIDKGCFVMALIALDLIAISSTAPHVPEKSSSAAPDIESSTATGESVGSSVGQPITDDDDTKDEPGEETVATEEPKTEPGLEELIESYSEHNSKLTDVISKLILFLDLGDTTSTEYDKHFNPLKNISESDDLPQNCSAATAANDYLDGLYILNVSEANIPPFFAYCIHEKPKGRAWMIIQRRRDGEVTFNRNWDDYKLGFGDLFGDYWIGLERISQLTRSKPHELWVSLMDHGYRERSAKYSTFVVASEKERYRLIADMYNGDAGDSLRFHNGLQFSTIELDHDRDFRNCAQFCKAGWWYNRCAYCNLNSRYRKSDDVSHQDNSRGVNWFGVDGPRYSYKYVHMAIRPLLKTPPASP